jgi:hypothetical protein
MTTELLARAPAQRPDNRLVQARNEEVILTALHRYGFLLGRQVAAIGWPNATTFRQAQRTLDNLRKARLVACQYTPAGAPAYSLTGAGATHARVAYGLDAAPGTNLLKRLFHHHEHRAIANDVCIWWQNKGLGGFNTEHEIASGRAVVTKVPALLGEVKGKVPDALLFIKPSDSDTPAKTFWVEAESKRKKTPEMQHMISVLGHMLAGYGRNKFELDSKHAVHYALVACPDVGHENQVVRAVLTLCKAGKYSSSSLLERILLWRPIGDVVVLADWLADRPDIVEEFQLHPNFLKNLKRP